MNARYVCVSCRLRCIARSPQSLPSHRPETPIVHWAHQRTNHTEGHASDLRQSGRYPRATDDTTDLHSISRYSRQRLVPQRVLEDLRHAAPAKAGSQDKAPSQSRAQEGLKPSHQLHRTYRTPVREPRIGSNKPASDQQALNPGRSDQTATPLKAILASTSTRSVAKPPGVEQIASTEALKVSSPRTPVSKRRSHGIGSDYSAFVEKCKAQLGRAIEHEDLRLARGVYDAVQRFPVTTGVRPPLELYEFLLHAFMSLRHRELIVPIWNDMIRADHEPTCKTYTVLMRGCQATRDLQAMKSFWLKMRSSRIQPDHHAWSTRIFGLMKSAKHVDEGLHALAEMAQDWFAAARTAHTQHISETSKIAKKRTTAAMITNPELLSKFPGDVKGVPRPNVDILNSAISALAGTKESVMPRVLSWGDSMRIDRDLTTYNALINVHMRQNMPDRAMGVLKTMGDRAIRPNSTTWTVLLTAFFSSDILRGVEADEVGVRVMDMIQHIDSQSSGMDVKGYALCIDRLLKVYKKHDVAQSIVQHMLSRGVQPTAEIYTILMTHYLEASPPDFDAADGLWSRIRSDRGKHHVPLDTVFFDRMIELYAPHYATVGMNTMSSFLDVAESQGKKLSWRAMETLARALAEAGELDRVARLAEKARRERDSGPGKKGEFGQASFWDYMQLIGLVTRDVQTGAVEMRTVAGTT